MSDEVLLSRTYKNRNVLVTGGTGLIGRPLVEFLRKREARVRVASLDQGSDVSEDVEFLHLDLTKWENCVEACRDIDYVFHLAGIKGGVGVGRLQAATFFTANAMLNLNMMEGARQAGVQKYLFTSTIGVYADPDSGEAFDDQRAIWDRPPHPSDWYGAWSKRLGELQAEAYLEQYHWKCAIVRPASVYGPYDRFDIETSMVIPALIKRVCDGENPMVVWGDGSAVRDFIYSRDCARGMLLCLAKYCETDPVNLGSGVGTTIRQLVETICNSVESPPDVIWDASKKTGNPIRLMNTEKARDVLGFTPSVPLATGIRETIAWYAQNRDRKKYDPLKEASA